jgi:hypothetical protein
MKPNRWFVVSIVVFLVLLFILEMQLPKNFSWTPTFRHTDKQPFGSIISGLKRLLDKVASSI